MNRKKFVTGITLGSLGFAFGNNELSAEEVKKNFPKKTKKMFIFKIGESENPASQQEIEDFCKCFKKAMKNNEHIVYHHALEVIELDLGN